MGVPDRMERLSPMDKELEEAQTLTVDDLREKLAVHRDQLAVLMVTGMGWMTLGCARRHGRAVAGPAGRQGGK